MPLEKLSRARIVEALNLLGRLAEKEGVDRLKRMRLLRDTPFAFKDKNIFVFESALNVV